MYKKIIRPLLFNLQPETAHKASMNLFKISNPFLNPFLPGLIHKNPVEIAGINFPNQLGLAAGFDKNAGYIDQLSNLGFGHIEVGTITPKAQLGNDKPRLFRLNEDSALINRMGFNNLGLSKIKSNLEKKKNNIIVGGNIGKNKITPNNKAYLDYLYSFEELYELVDYFTINISSPNTPGLRELQDQQFLEKLLKEIDKKRIELKTHLDFNRPIFVKISPDMNQYQLDQLLDICLSNNIDGIVATNTTISRDNLTNNIKQDGGLSGKPLQTKSNQIINYIWKITNGKLPIIGVGGVFSKDDFNRKIDSGASLVQVYTGFIYEGPFISKKILL